MRYVLLAWLLAAAGWAHAQNPPTITQYEYWFDRDHGARTPVAVASPTTTIDLLNQSPDVSDLPVGPHRIHYRLRDSQGRWSGVLQRDFMRLPGGPHHIVGFEYWFDRNDAAGQRTYMAVGSPATDVDLITDIGMVNVPVGAHRIHYRLKDIHGRWSGVLQRDFRRNHDGPHEVVLLRYWSGQDPHPAVTEVPIATPTQHIDIIDDVLFCNWNITGQVTPVYFQLKDNHGQWSSVVSKSINVGLVAAAPGTPGAITGPGGVQSGSQATYSVPSMQGVAYYEWTLPSGWSGNSTTNSITITAGAGGDDGTISAVAVNGCGASGAVSMNVTVSGNGIAGMESSSGIALFPNPTTGQFSVNADAPITRLLVYNSTGQVVREQGNVGTDRVELALDNMAAGLYVVRVFQGEARTDLRLMLQR